MSELTSNAATVKHFIGGEKIDSHDGATFESLDPETDQAVAVVAKATSRDADTAVLSASKAFNQFRNAAPSIRERLLYVAADVLESNRDEIIGRLIREIGSPIGKANLEMQIAGETLRATAGIARRVAGRTYSAQSPLLTGGQEALSFSKRVPLGVTLGITPFNVPLIKGIKHTSMALATGNAVVWLPSPETAWIADAVVDVLAEAFERVGLDASLLNVVHGFGGEVGDALVSHPLVKSVGFTGSTKTGRHVQATCGRHGKRVTLELGGKNALLVLNDADVTAAIQAAVKGAFIYQGQICMSTSRIIVCESVAEAFTEKLVAAASNLSLGPLSEPSTVIGPIINADARGRIAEHLKDAVDQGATLLCGGKWQGHRLNPTIVQGVTPFMRIATEETFGPVVALEFARDEEHAADILQAGPSMLVASIFTRQIDRALKWIETIPASMVHVNEMTIRQQAEVPFGGEGDSGFGREGLETGIDDFTTWKWVTIR
ncbi:MAG: aldehyde dehydrogenase family protein [Planctomycetota bacterium]